MRSTQTGERRLDTSSLLFSPHRRCRPRRPPGGCTASPPVGRCCLWLFRLLSRLSHHSGQPRVCWWNPCLTWTRASNTSVLKSKSKLPPRQVLAVYLYYHPLDPTPFSQDCWRDENDPVQWDVLHRHPNMGEANPVSPALWQESNQDRQGYRSARTDPVPPYRPEMSLGLFWSGCTHPRSCWKSRHYQRW